MRATDHSETVGSSLRPPGPVQLGLTLRQQAGATVLAVTGELDIFTAPKLTTSLDDIIRRHRGEVVIDLGAAGFIDSLGLHTLLIAQRRLARQRRSLTVICGRGAVRHAIELARLDEALGLVSSFADYERAGEATPG